jgi:hypothetical protein
VGGSGVAKAASGCLGDADIQGVSLWLRRLSYDHKGRPQAWIGVSVELRGINHCQHRLPKRLSVGELWVTRTCAQRADHQPCRCFIAHAPMGDDERSCSGIEKGPSKPGQSFRAWFVFRCRVAGGEHGPIGIELQLRDFAGGQEPVIVISGLIRDGQGQRWFNLALRELVQVARNQAVRREIDNAVLVELCLLDGGFSCIQSELYVVGLCI